MFKDLVKANRSYRGFDSSVAITRDELLDLVDHARLTPSSINSQPFKYFLAYEKEIVAKIQPATKWAGALSHLNLPREGKCPTAFIVICLDLNLGRTVANCQKDVGIVAQTILLAATEKGLGGCMIGSYNTDEISESLNLDESIVPVLVIGLGKPDETIIIEEIPNGDSIKYYRDENDVHFVPKRKLEDIIL